MNKLHVLVFTKDQLNMAFNKMNSEMNCKIERIYVDSSLALSEDFSREDSLKTFLAGPYVLRNKDKNRLYSLLNGYDFKGILVRNLETLGFLNENHHLWPSLTVVLDTSMYVLNQRTLKFYVKESLFEIKEFYSSYELNQKETEDVIGEMPEGLDCSRVVYGRIPMMVSANCVRKTLSACSKTSGFLELHDRTGADHVVFTDCSHCYNVIFNAIPLSLHKYIERFGSANLRLDFTNESEETEEKVIDYFYGLLFSYTDPFYRDFTTGHIKRGVE